MLVSVLICEVHSDEDRLLGVYLSHSEAVAAFQAWENRSIYPFYRIERREIGASASEYLGD